MATYTPLSTDFKDDILASQNSKRKYTQVNNSDGTVSFQDSTAYSQVGSSYGAKEVNEEREAINNIYANKLVTLDEIDLVTEPGFFVDAQVVKELNSKIESEPLLKRQYFSQSITVVANGVASVTMGAISVPEGYELWGILPDLGGFGDQWTVTFTRYGDGVTAKVKSYFTSTLTSRISCSVVYVRNS